ncbi:MAG: hypothetical protein ABSA68_13835 [Xanthobacteraceae bacterium]|jgi:hypothetical protein
MHATVLIFGLLLTVIGTTAADAGDCDVIAHAANSYGQSVPYCNPATITSDQMVTIIDRMAAEYDRLVEQVRRAGQAEQMRELKEQIERERQERLEAADEQQRQRLNDNLNMELEMQPLLRR